MWEETLLFVLVRLIVPLVILRWPFGGGVLALATDALDIVMVSLIDWGGVWSYHRLDKYLDSYYLTLEAIVSLRWVALERWTALTLYAYRMVGVVLFEATGVRAMLFFFPALLENFFLFNAGRLQFFPQYELTPRRLAGWLAVLLVPKMVQEYFIHYRRALDDVVAVDVIEDIKDGMLNWFRDRV